MNQTGLTWADLNIYVCCMYIFRSKMNLMLPDGISVMDDEKKKKIFFNQTRKNDFCILVCYQ